MIEASVFAIDDDASMRDSLEFLFNSAGLPARIFDSASSFLQFLPRIHVGCIVTDIHMPDINGIELLKRVKSEKPMLSVIVMTGHGDIALAVEAMKLGAADFIENPFDDERLIGAVQMALADVINADKEKTISAQIMDRVAILSSRERQVLEGLVAGSPNKVIARNYDISPRTVEVYRANVMSKMQASSLSELVRMALRAGIIKD